MADEPSEAVENVMFVGISVVPVTLSVWHKILAPNTKLLPSHPWNWRTPKLSPFWTALIL